MGLEPPIHARPSAAGRLAVARAADTPEPKARTTLPVPAGGRRDVRTPVSGCGVTRLIRLSREHLNVLLPSDISDISDPVHILTPAGILSTLLYIFGFTKVTWSLRQR